MKVEQFRMRCAARQGRAGQDEVRSRLKLLLSDVNMPNMDALTMVEKIRGELAGIKGWIVKPFNGAAVLETFKKLAA